MKTLKTTKLRALLLNNVTGVTQAGQQGLSLEGLEELFNARNVLNSKIKNELDRNKTIKNDEDLRGFLDSIRDKKIELEFEDGHFSGLFQQFQKIQWRVESLELYGDEIFLMKKDMNDANSNVHANAEKVKNEKK